MTKARTVRVTRLKRDLNDAIRDCRESYRKARRDENHSECIKLDGLMYAYEFVRDELLNPAYDEEK